MMQSLLTHPQIINPYPFKLKPQQQQTLAKLRELLSSTESFFLLCGYAGTGKSTIIVQFIKELLQQGKRIALTAPTNKAVNILKKMAAKHGILGVDLLVQR